MLFLLILLDDYFHFTWEQKKKELQEQTAVRAGLVAKARDWAVICPPVEG